MKETLILRDIQSTYRNVSIDFAINSCFDSLTLLVGPAKWENHNITPGPLVKQ